MPVVAAYRNGGIAYMSSPGGTHERVKRGVVQGWSREAVRRHTKFLYSVDCPRLTGYGYALTLTVRDCPPSAVEWKRVREAFVKRLTRHKAGFLRLHWVTEWQRRGVPHMHAAVYFESELTGREIALLIKDWTDCAAIYGARGRAQTAQPIDGVTGWLRYLSKHAARGVAHYQRQGSPEGWESTGRLWGHRGSWPVDDPLTFSLDRAGWFRFRRLVRSWRIANARAAGSSKRVRQARGMLGGSDQRSCSVRPVNEWLPEAVTVAFMALLVQDGYSVMAV